MVSVELKVLPWTRKNNLYGTSLTIHSSKGGGGNGRFSLSLIKHHDIDPYPTAFPYGNGMLLHFYQQQESSTTKTVHKVINKGLKTYV